MTLKTTIGNVQERLLRIYREFSGERRVDLKSQMCRMWKDPTIEIVLGSDELAVLENEFGIKFDDDSAQDLYEANLGEAAERLNAMILAQRKTPYDPDELINALTAKTAKQVLRHLWKNSIKGRPQIFAAIEHICGETQRGTGEQNPMEEIAGYLNQSNISKKNHIRLILLTASWEPAVARLAQSVRALATPPMRKLRRWQTLAANDPTSFLLLEKMGLTPDYYYGAQRFDEANDSDDDSNSIPF
ncbi:MAG: hypothetical protein WC708_09240 [Lentisphaeria bacterium]